MELLNKKIIRVVLFVLVLVSQLTFSIGCSASSGGSSSLPGGGGDPILLPPTGTDSPTLTSALSELAFRVDATQASSILNASSSTASTGEEVDQWQDLSGQAVHLVYTTNYSATRTKLMTEPISSLPALYFDGDLNTLRATSNSNLVLSDNTKTGWTILIVAKPEKQTTVGSSDLWGDGGPSMLMSYGGDKDWKRIQINYKANAADFNILGSKILAPGVTMTTALEDYFHVVAMVDHFDVTDSKVSAFVGGQKVSEILSSNTIITVTGTDYTSIPHSGFLTGITSLDSPSAGLYSPLIYHNNTPAGDRGPLTIGSESKASAAGRSFKGFIGEVIVLKKALTDAEVTTVSEELYKKWGSESGF